MLFRNLINSVTGRVEKVAQVTAQQFSNAACVAFINIAAKPICIVTLAEFDFRYSRRVKLGYSDMDRANMVLKGIVGKRLTYRQAY